MCYVCYFLKLNIYIYIYIYMFIPHLYLRSSGMLLSVDC